MAVIVVIEDQADSARLVEKLLKKAGHDVRLAVDGETGLTTVFGGTPDLVLVDLGLPDIDGQTVVALLRQQAALKTIPMLAFTAWPEHTAQEMAKAYGCDGVIAKPIDTRTFAAQVEAYLPPKPAPAVQAEPPPASDPVTEPAPLLQTEPPPTSDPATEPAPLLQTEPPPASDPATNAGAAG